jgi:hypothetical protein
LLLESPVDVDPIKMRQHFDDVGSCDDVFPGQPGDEFGYMVFPGRIGHDPEEYGLLRGLHHVGLGQHPADVQAISLMDQGIAQRGSGNVCFLQIVEQPVGIEARAVTERPGNCRRPPLALEGQPLDRDVEILVRDDPAEKVGEKNRAAFVGDVERLDDQLESGWAEGPQLLNRLPGICIIEIVEIFEAGNQSARASAAQDAHRVPAPGFARVIPGVTECAPGAERHGPDKHASGPRGAAPRGAGRCLAQTPLVIQPTLHGVRTFATRECLWYRDVSATIAAPFRAAELAMERFVERFNI